MEEESHNIALIPGDLNGRTVTNAVLEVARAVEPILKKPIIYTTFDYNADYFLKHNMKELGEKELGILKEFDQIFLGAVGDPTKIAPGVLEIGILLKIRQEFDQYINLRPVVLPEGVPSIIVGKDHNDINFEICRENSEGLYVDIGWVEKPGTDEEAAYQVMKCTYRGVKRLAEFAEQRAFARKKGNKPTLHFIFKTNILTKAGSPWKRVLEEYQKRDYINAEYMHVDAFIMAMVQAPEQFDVVVTENMFGDITTDLGAVLQGGIGTAVSGNINPTGEFPSMFEPIHGSAPDKWYGKDAKGRFIPDSYFPEKIALIRPEAAFLSYAMMLEYINEIDAANAVKQAALVNMKDLDYNTKQLDELISRACKFIRAI